MRLFKVTFMHYSQKDSAEGIKEYLLADTEHEVVEHIDVNHAWESWSDRDPIDVWDEKLEKLIERPFLDKILKERGDYWEEVSDLYYGATQFGWEEGVEISDTDAEVLLRLGIAVKFEPAKEDET